MKDATETIRVLPDVMKSEFKRVLLKYSFSEHDAESCARILMVNTLEGVNSHGVNRFARMISYIRDGYIVPGNKPALRSSNGAVEQWNGNIGPGPINASFATDRAVELASESGIGMVALANTNHWMRGGTYGWQAARKGFAFIGWTNTEANMPAWGSKQAKLGNNPLVFAVPFDNEAIVLDFAMSQFSYGKMETYKLSGQKLPFQGGFNSDGVLTDDPAGILETRRTLPIGYWKGAGLSLLLDIFAVVLSGGKSTAEVTATGTEMGLSQVFIAIRLKGLDNHAFINESVRKIIDDYKSGEKAGPSDIIRYPGENILILREKNKKEGIPVNKRIWENVLEL